MGYAKAIAKATLQRVRRVFVLLVSLSLVLSSSVVLSPHAQAMDVASHASHEMAAQADESDAHARHHTSGKQTPDNPCGKFCHCKGAVMTHCCAHASPIAALGDAAQPLQREATAERLESRTRSGESEAILPPTPPPKSVPG